MERALSLDCLILRAIPDFDSDNGCRPLVRIFGPDLLGKNASMTDVIFSMPKKKSLPHYRQKDCDVIKIDIQWPVQGDVVLECVHLDLDAEKEVMMFRIMFNTAFIRSNLLMLNSDDVDIIWGSKDRYPRNFRAEVLFCEIGAISPPSAPIVTLNGDMKVTSSQNTSCRPPPHGTCGPLSTEPSLPPAELQQELLRSSWQHPPLSAENGDKHVICLAHVSLPAATNGSKSIFLAPPLPPQLSGSKPVSSLAGIPPPPRSPPPRPCGRKPVFSPLPPPPPPPPRSPRISNVCSSQPPPPPSLPNSQTGAPLSAPILHPRQNVQRHPVRPPPQSSPQAQGIAKTCPPPPPCPPPSSSRTFATTATLSKVSPPPPRPPPSGAQCPPTPPPLPAPPTPPPPTLMTGKKAPALRPLPPQAPKLPRVVPPPPPGSKISNAPAPPPLMGRGRAATGSAKGHGIGFELQNTPPKKASLKPLHWVKVARAMQGSLWAGVIRPRFPDIDMSELETLFSTDVATNAFEKGGMKRGSAISKLEIIHLVDMRRANNCEIMLTEIKMPLPDMISAVLALDTSVLDNDEVENLIKFCPTNEEIEMLKNYNGNKEMLGKCEQFFLELMKVPRFESKLRVFAYIIAFSKQADELRTNLTTILNATREVRESLKLNQIMHTILTLGNVLNEGTARGSAVGFRLDSLLKLSDTRARDNKMTLMHYLCKLLAEKLPELLDFDKELIHLEAASKIQLKMLPEEMQAMKTGLEKVEQELIASVNDGVISFGFRKALKCFLESAEDKVRSLISFYSEVGRHADSLSQYFSEDPSHCPFEQVTWILVTFVNIFKESCGQNARPVEDEKKKMEKEKATVSTVRK